MNFDNAIALFRPKLLFQGKAFVNLIQAEPFRYRKKNFRLRGLSSMKYAWMTFFLFAFTQASAVSFYQKTKRRMRHDQKT
jgi:hypothetical protein